MYELGFATPSKEVMMITQSAKCHSFRHLRFYPYSNDISGVESAGEYPQRAATK